MPPGIDVPACVRIVRAHCLLTYICIVTPHARRSLTLSTLLITSRPRSSNTNTFHIGAPSSLNIGAETVTRPLVADVSCVSLSVSGVRFRFKTFCMAPGIHRQYESRARTQAFPHTCLAVSQGLMRGGHRADRGEQMWRQSLDILIYDGTDRQGVRCFYQRNESLQAQSWVAI